MKWTRGLAGLAVLGGAVLYFKYLPFRKAVHRLNPAWRRESALYKFDPSAEEAEERDLFVSATVLRDGCDVIWREKSPEPPDELFGDLPEGTVVFVNLLHLERFLRDVLPQIKQPVVLVTGCDDKSPSVEGYEQLYQHPMLIHSFVQNCDFPLPENGRVTVCPIGLNYHKLDPSSDNQSRDMGLPSRPGNQQLTMKAIRDEIPALKERPLSVYANFHLNMDTFLRHPRAKLRMRARTEALEVLRQQSCVFFEDKQRPRNVVWKRYRNHTFEASPRGNGLDCHRTWEAVILKTVPIVKRSPIDSVYDGLPVAFVDDWREVTPERLAEWVEEFAPAFEGELPRQLYSNYWLEKFRSFRPAE